MAEVQNQTFRDLHKGFVDELTEKGRSESTVIAYAKDIEQLLNFLSSKGTTGIDSITIDDLESFKTDLQENNYTPKSVSRKINSTRTFYKYLLESGKINDNPAEKLAHPKFDVKPPRVLSEMEYRALRDVSRVDVRLYSIVELLLQTGIRIGELANLSLEDVKESKSGIRYIYIKNQGSHPSRKVPLNNSAYQAIQDYLKVRPESDDDTLFITKNGRPLLVRNIRTAIDKAFEKSGIKNAKVNDLRNTFIAHHLANGVSLVTVSKLVGHKRLSTTEKYLNLIRAEKEDQEKNLKEL
ncbi:tyrosine-type recombinase/integrase [Candidatus Nomurabacteria bacterium]|uniref:Tyrosine-type recombinase/integrase n=1 Tax=Candidatus Dojkabacteria bacterium TaxID=2099670 RepID=A0A955I5J3_9BACT|nr:tyrosine-type recombinase/integrase [Candidatus Dojkabacteria bacterium]MCB9789670.1 tyrosine-type recombinase/integrase [Candidatus Nomurabacteria bacterium]MCB9803989.1 tyrosine-type recombinase/integrase [Candidatus Nomurabacteria bacterium]